MSSRIDLIAAPQPVEYRLSDLRKMRVSELKRVLNKAGVFFDPVNVVEKEDLVQIFLNSGRLSPASESLDDDDNDRDDGNCHVCKVAHRKEPESKVDAPTEYTYSYSNATAPAVTTSLMGFLYGKVPGIFVQIVWTTLPQFLHDKLHHQFRPALFFTGACTVGGLLLGLLTSRFGNVHNFAVSDFVERLLLSNQEALSLPSSRVCVPPLLLLSLVTSLFRDYKHQIDPNLN